jgi:tRNA(Ile)-lysidine synthase
MTHLDAVIGQLSSLQGSVVVGLSGGADSAVLAYCAIEAGLRPDLLFVHHGLAGSDKMERAASRVADHLGAPLTIVQAVMRGTSETEARAVRYTMFERVDAPTILLGHTLSDQAETVLMHLLRGSGPVGMAGIPRKRGQFLRPLMDLPRLQVRSAAKTLGLPFADDPENDSSAHLRNWVRSSVIPLLQDRSPDVERLLARTASLTTRPEVYSVEVGSAAQLPLAVLRTLSASQRSESLREAVRRLRPPYPASFSEVLRMEEVVFGGAPRAELEGALVVLRDRTSLFVGPTPDVSRPVKVANGVRWGRWSFSESPRRRTSSLWSRVPRASIVRGAVVGDTLSMGSGSKDVFSALAESGVPRELRFCWPVIEHDGDVVWVPGIRRAPKAEEANEGYLGLDATEETW